MAPEAKENDYVLVHVGVALSLVDEEEATKTLEYLKQMNELDELYNSSIKEPLIKEETAKKAGIIISKRIE